MTELAIFRQLIGVEDLLTGMSSENQNRGGKSVPVSGITAMALGGVQVVNGLASVDLTYAAKLANAVVYDLETRQHYKYNRTTAQWDTLASVNTQKVAEEAEPVAYKVEETEPTYQLAKYSFVHELPRSATNGDIAIVTDTTRGGIFSFVETEKDSYDGGIMFYGWKRMFSGPAKASWYEEAHHDKLFNNVDVFIDANISTNLNLGVHKVMRITGDGKHTLGSLAKPVSIKGVDTTPQERTCTNGKFFVDGLGELFIGSVLIDGEFHKFSIEVKPNGLVDLSSLIANSFNKAIDGSYPVQGLLIRLKSISIDESVQVCLKDAQYLGYAKLMNIKSYGGTISNCAESVFQLNRFVTHVNKPTYKDNVGIVVLGEGAVDVK